MGSFPLLDRHRLGRGSLESAGGTFGWGGGFWFAQRRLPIERVGAREVNARFEARAGAGDVAPLAEGGVAGEGVAIVEVLGRVLEGNTASGSRVADRQLIILKPDDGAPHAVAQTEVVVVLSAQHLVAHPVLAVAKRDRTVVETAVAKHERVCGTVEL